MRAMSPEFQAADRESVNDFVDMVSLLGGVVAGVPFDATRMLFHGGGTHRVTSSFWGVVEQVVVRSPDGCRRTRGHPDLREDVLQVVVDRLGRDAQRLRDLLVGL